MPTVRILAQGEVPIPEPLCQQLAIAPGDMLEVTLCGDHIELRPVPKDPIAAFSASLSSGTSLCAGLAAEHRDECLNIRQWPAEVLAFTGMADMPQFEAGRQHLKPPTTDPLS